MTRLAIALETTAEDLLGGGRDRPPGPGSGSADAHRITGRRIHGL
ncbi:hypothetical protein ACWEPL_29550 [Nonomuraea sp. NPDC004186]